MKSEIDKSEYKRLERISKATGTSMDELLKQFESEYKTLVAGETKGNLERLAVNAIVNAKRRENVKQSFMPRNKPELVSGFIWGETGCIDKAEITRRQAKGYVKREGRQAAIDAQLIDGDNHVLDQRQKIYGRENPHYLEALPENLKLLSRTLFGIWRLNGSETFKFGTIHTEDNKLATAWDTVRRFRPCTTYAIIKENDGDMKMNSSGAEGTETVFRAIQEDWDILSIIEDVFGWGKSKDKTKFTPLNKIEQHFETFKDAWDRFIVVRGVVGWINLDRLTPWGSVWASLIDSDLGYEADYRVRILIPDHVKINFGEGSEVIVLGKTKRSKYRDDDGNLVDGDVIINVWGIYPIPGLTTELGEPKAELSSDEQIEGWFE